MTFTTLISTQELVNNLDDPNWVIVDCRFGLSDTEQGRRDYQVSHIAGAVYAHLDEDLCAPIIPGQTGRHPLPEIGDFVQTLSHWGIDDKTQVVAYDTLGGSIAVRLWWMLHWLGHQNVAVLNGGWQHWLNENYATQGGIEVNTARTFTPHPQPQLLLQVQDVEKLRTNPTYRIFDSRSAERYRGQNEPFDPVAGHIPGTMSLPFEDNLKEDKSFLAADELKARFEAHIGDIPPERTAFYCGSGVTAIHNILAMAYAGLGFAQLYAGSWSEWITDPNRPVATDS